MFSTLLCSRPVTAGGIRARLLGADDWSTEQMQASAAAFGQETGFVLEPQHGGDIRLRYFVPRHEMEMCVHATVAAVVVLGRRGALARETVSVETPLGQRAVRWDGRVGSAVVEQSRPRFDAPVEEVDDVLDVLALGPEHLNLAVGPVQSVSTARAKLMIPLVDERSLDAVVLDAAAAWDVCDRLGVTGLYPFTVVAEGADAAARQFPRRAGYDEDPATGVAACALGSYLTTYHPRGGVAVGWQRHQIAQGRAMGRPSVIHAEALLEHDGRVTATRVGGSMRLERELSELTPPPAG
jgi:PhzF family phenazine biosynthesis protein